MRCRSLWVATLALLLALSPAPAGEKPETEPGGKPTESGGDGGKPATEKPEKGKAEDGPKSAESGGDGGQAEDPALAKVLATLDKTNRAMKTLEAPYLQKRKVRISRRIRKSWGIFRLEKRPKPKGMRILFEETKPHRLKLLFTDTRVAYHDMTSGKVEERDPRQGGVRPSELWVVGRPLAELKKSYAFVLAELTEKEAKLYAAHLKLTPRSKKIRKWVTEMHIWLGKKRAIPLRVKLVDPRKEWQEFVFDPAKLKVNAKLDAKLFAVGG